MIVYSIWYEILRHALHIVFFIGFNCAIAVGGAVNDSTVRHHYDAVQCIENNVCTRVRNCFSAHERVILVLISRVAKQLGKYQNSTWVSGETVCNSSTYIILFLTRHNESINDDKNNIFTHRPCVSLAPFSFCWWHHNQLLMTSQWPNNCDEIKWIVISNSLDMDFIHGEIQGRLCKKTEYWMQRSNDKCNTEIRCWTHAPKHTLTTGYRGQL